jgi:hypothetical protein
MLCSECDGSSSRNGEAYVIRRLSKDGVFPFLDRLNVAMWEPDFLPGGAYRGDSVGLDTEKTAYFALSLLWRASVHKWETLNGQTTSVVLDDPSRKISADICSARRAFRRIWS